MLRVSVVFIHLIARSAMSVQTYLLESEKPFGESLIWQLNREYYQEVGVEAWRSQKVPHQLTSNSMVGMTYAELIFGVMKDLARQGKLEERLYILELGAGHGRLAFHIIVHLQRLLDGYNSALPPFCYVISDFVESNLSFFSNHPQFQDFINQGILDVAYFDAINSNELALRHSNVFIKKDDLSNPLVAIANYFFDSIPADLFHIQNGKINNCNVALHTDADHQSMTTTEKLDNINIEFINNKIKADYYSDTQENEVLNEYRGKLFDTYLLFPHAGFQCIRHLHDLSKSGLIVLTMDKGYHKLSGLDNHPAPEMITHGSMSMAVNFHALGSYCDKKGGVSKFSEYSNFDLELGCLLIVKDAKSYSETLSSYERFVNNYGPDDFNGMKLFSYKHIASMTMRELIGAIRMSHYDSTVFIKLLPRIKQVMQHISRSDRDRLNQTLHRAWSMYFTFNETHDLAFEIGGMLYALGYYQEALDYFNHSVRLYGHTTDEYYNRILCHYQLRQDALFSAQLKEGKATFPNFDGWTYLDGLDLNAE